MTIGTLPDDVEIDLHFVAVAQAALDLDELRDLGMVLFAWDLDLEGIRYIVCRGAQLGLSPSRKMVAIAAGELVTEMEGNDEFIWAAKNLVRLIDKARTWKPKGLGK